MLKSRKKVLIIDDEPMLTSVVKTNLEATGNFQVKYVNKAPLGLAMAREFQPDIILLDILMPEIDGASLARKLSQDKATKDIPIIFVTAVAKAKDVNATDGCIGGRPFVAKPFETNELIRAINNYLIK